MDAHGCDTCLKDFGMVLPQGVRMKDECRSLDRVPEKLVNASHLSKLTGRFWESTACYIPSGIFSISRTTRASPEKVSCLVRSIPEHSFAAVMRARIAFGCNIIATSFGIRSVVVIAGNGSLQFFEAQRIAPTALVAILASTFKGRRSQ